MTMAFDPRDIFAGRGILRLGGQGRVRYALWEKGIARLYEGSPFGGGQPGRETVKLAGVHVLAPCRPSKVVAVGLNYKAHAQEVKMPLPETPMLFLKPDTSVIGPGQAIVRPLHMSRRVDYEAELGVVMGRACHGVSVEDAPAYVLGYTCLNDVTARDLQAKDGQFTRAKGFDTFCPLGPVIALDLDPADLRVQSLVNGQVRQDSRTSDLIFSVAELVSFISRVMTLKPGDVIATGTPAGIGPLADGDVVTIEIEGVGRLNNPVTSRG
jgi:2-keto-4-pentenoate hydratase/2-oxohepta-3-ene-1,7-dioic acid hydratase in catechol pathway